MAQINARSQSPAESVLFIGRQLQQLGRVISADSAELMYKVRMVIIAAVKGHFGQG